MFLTVLSNGKFNVLLNSIFVFFFLLCIPAAGSHIWNIRLYTCTSVVDIVIQRTTHRYNHTTHQIESNNVWSALCQLRLVHVPVPRWMFFFFFFLLDHICASVCSRICFGTAAQSKYTQSKWVCLSQITKWYWFSHYNW